MKKGKSPAPLADIIGSQLVKTVILYQDNAGYVGCKKDKREKKACHYKWFRLNPNYCNTFRTTHNSKSAESVFKILRIKHLDGMVKIFANEGYQGKFVEIARLKVGCTFEIVKPIETKKLQVLLKR